MNKGNKLKVFSINLANFSDTNGGGCLRLNKQSPLSARVNRLILNRSETNLNGSFGIIYCYRVPRPIKGIRLIND